MSEELYSECKARRADWLELPTQNVLLKSAFTGKTKMVKRQALVPTKVNDVPIDQILLISSQLVTPLILGMDFCVENQVVIDFPRKAIIVNADDKDTVIKIDLVNERLAEDSRRPSSRVIYLETADCQPIPQLDRLGNLSVYDPPTLQYNEGISEEDKCPKKTSAEDASLDNEEYGLVNGLVVDYIKNEDRAARALNHSVNEEVEGSIAESKDGHTDIKDVRHVKVRSAILEEGRGANQEVFRRKIEGLNARGNNDSLSVDRVQVGEHLSGEEKTVLLEVLKKYQEHFDTKPGKCNFFEYKFHMQGDLPKSSNARAIPFSLRQEVREQIQEMIGNGILEISHSPYVNPLTVIQREHKPVRICVDARRVNKQMVPDRTKTLPAHELLQRIHGANYISSIDLNSAFLQIPLEESSRKWTAFHFEGQTLQFARMPFGFRNSLASFIRALQQVLGSDSTGYVLNYVDDILVYSKTYEEHLGHLDAVLGKLTKAGFTINLDKCVFGKQEIKFLGHVISDKLSCAA
jgi:hypothetical protein